MFYLIIAAVQIGGLLLAAYCDITKRIIPNSLCLAVAATGLIGRLLVGLIPFTISLGIATGVLLIFMILFIRRWIGGGDVKLIVAMTLGLSPIGIMALFYVMTVAGGGLAILYLAMRWLPRPRLASSRSAFRRIYAVERWRIFKHGPLPYGVAICIGGIWAVLSNGV